MDAIKLLVIGPAKTGTTVIASTLTNSLPGAIFNMEPKSVAFFEDVARKSEARVVKILYDDWKGRTHLLDGLVAGETGFVANRIVATMRDPRDNAISRMFYQVYWLVHEKGASREQVARWIGVVERKQRQPASLTLAQVLEEMNGIFSLAQDLPGLVMGQFAEYSGWLDAHRDIIHVLLYEDFIAGRLKELEGYLGFALTDRREVPQVLHRVRRSAGSGSWKAMMLAADVTLLRDACGGTLARRGYDDWTLAEAPYLDPAHGTEYLARIANDAFARVEWERREMQSRDAAKTAKPTLSWGGLRGNG